MPLTYLLHHQVHLEEKIMLQRLKVIDRGKIRKEMERRKVRCREEREKRYEGREIVRVERRGGRG